MRSFSSAKCGTSVAWKSIAGRLHEAELRHELGRIERAGCRRRSRRCRRPAGWPARRCSGSANFRPPKAKRPIFSEPCPSELSRQGPRSPSRRDPRSTGRRSGSRRARTDCCRSPRTFMPETPKRPMENADIMSTMPSRASASVIAWSDSSGCAMTLSRSGREAVFRLARLEPIDGKVGRAAAFACGQLHLDALVRGVPEDGPPDQVAGAVAGILPTDRRRGSSRRDPCRSPRCWRWSRRPGPPATATCILHRTGGDRRRLAVLQTADLEILIGDARGDRL